MSTTPGPDFTADIHIASESALARMVRAVEKVRERLRRTTTALATAGIPYAVIGGNAIAAWVGAVDESAVRNTPDVDILVRRAELEKAKQTLEAAGFSYRHSSGIDLFLDDPRANPRNAVRIFMAQEKMRPEDLLPTPDVSEASVIRAMQVLGLEPLVKMKLTSFRDKDRTHLRDLIGVNLVDATWLDRLPPPLAERLQQILDTPDG